MANGAPCNPGCKLCREPIPEPAPMTQAQAWNAWARYENRRRAWSAEHRAAHRAEGAAAFSHDRLI